MIQGRGAADGTDSNYLALEERDSISLAAMALCCHSLVLKCACAHSGADTSHTHTLAQTLTPGQR